ncbi:O-antigen ligase family protein [Deinococcus sp. QL22]|uniref:O-antigen ligase family protein n=1 Tax=Deinococcus sp. QL22 TaxID=2939437 RepID=UPI0020179FC9|nr:O-antigen ligase family protein [Deinococcus sp. QL22]UQN09556.1 O-antigen ligase family protein [Deinococcus sp. QL22]
MSVPPDSPASPPRWIAPWLAASPAMYLLSPLALLALPYLRTLPQPVLWILGFYALSQQLPALFSPEPLLASATALVRTALMFGLIGVGVALKDSQRLRPLAIGVAIIYATALIFSVAGGNDFLISRLTHPYMTPIALGLAGAFGIWTALFIQGHLLWRVPLGLAAIGILLLSGSRGPLAAALVGCMAGLIVRRGRKTALALLLGAVVLLGGFYVGDRLGISAVSRLGSADTTGRDIVWYNTLTVIQSEPWSGVGSYRLGKYLAPPSESCPVVTTLVDNTGCPEWIEKLGSPWLIAHNLTLQQLAETGPLGLLGLFVLLGSIGAAALTTRNSLAVAVLSGLLAATITDNTLLVPTPFFGEVFWVVAGMQLLHMPVLKASAGWLGAGLGAVLSTPLFANALIMTPHLTQREQITLLIAPNSNVSQKQYTAFVQLNAPSGQYRAALHSCNSYCKPLETLSFEISESISPLLTFKVFLPLQEEQTLELRLLPGRSSLHIQPLSIKRWTVRQRL